MSFFLSKGDDIFDKISEKVELIFKDKIALDGRKNTERTNSDSSVNRPIV